MVAQTQKTQKTNLNNINLYYKANALVCRNISPHGGGVQLCPIQNQTVPYILKQREY